MRVRNGANTINQIVAVGRNRTAVLKQNRRELASPENGRAPTYIRPLQKAAEISGVAGEFPLPQPASVTNL